MNIGRLFGSAVVLCALNCSAMATETLSCSVDDKNIEFDFQAHVGSVADAAQPSIIKLRVKKHASAPVFVYPAEDKTQELHLGQQWISMTDIRLRIYTLSGVDLVIKTKNPKPGDEFDYSGTYEFSISIGGIQLRHKGRATCSYG